jgi:hypothetical protein
MKYLTRLAIVLLAPGVLLWGCSGTHAGEAGNADSGPDGSATLCPLCEGGEEAYELPDSDTKGESVDGSDGSSFSLATVIRLGQNDECLPQALPMTRAGGTLCAIVLTGLTGGCSGAGLSPATADEIAALERANAAYGGGSVCALNQHAASGPSGAGCADPQAVGFCYVEGSCLGDAGPGCAQDLCTTSAFNAHAARAPHEARARVLGGMTWPGRTIIMVS